MRTELVTSLKRKGTDLISEISLNREHIMITQQGFPSAYLMDVESYQTMQDRIELLEGITKGEKAIREGRVVKQAEAKKRMARWLE
jgi:prevent-host-death family protein